MVPYYSRRSYCSVSHGVVSLMENQPSVCLQIWALSLTDEEMRSLCHPKSLGLVKDYVCKQKTPLYTFTELFYQTLRVKRKSKTEIDHVISVASQEI